MIYSVIFISIFIILIDLYTFRGMSILLAKTSFSPIYVVWIKRLFWVIPAFIIVGTFILMATYSPDQAVKFFPKLYWISGPLILFYVPKLLFCTFLLIEDLTRLIFYIIPSLKQGIYPYISIAGFISMIVLLGFILHGILIGRYDYTVERITIESKRIPGSFNGFRIVQISDMHLGSMQGSEVRFNKAIDIINAEKPDLILFTGDMVNTLAMEAESFIPYLSRLEAKHGKYSVLGNHDYGEYFEWKTPADRAANNRKLETIQAEAGFRLLKNENVYITQIDDSIALIGVENWGLPPFPAYGDLNKAISGVQEETFKVLLSHDPTHFKEQVVGQTNIDLTLSGHTHAMQFAVRIGSIKWSPVQWKYKNWAGLYTENSQMLYVNRGIGFIGFPGRVGSAPEITLIELKRVD